MRLMQSAFDVHSMHVSSDPGVAGAPLELPAPLELLAEAEVPPELLLPLEPPEAPDEEALALVPEPEEPAELAVDPADELDPVVEELLAEAELETELPLEDEELLDEELLDEELEELEDEDELDEDEDEEELEDEELEPVTKPPSGKSPPSGNAPVPPSGKSPPSGKGPIWGMAGGNPKLGSVAVIVAEENPVTSQ